MAATSYSGRPPMSTFFIEDFNIHKDVIMTDIARYLGEVADIKGGSRWDPKLGRQLYGYFITAHRPPNSDQMKQLKRDSAAWSLELERRSYNRGTMPVQAPYPGTHRMNSAHSENIPSITDPYRNGHPPQESSTYTPSPFSYSPPPPLTQPPYSTAQSPGVNIKDIMLMHPQNVISYNAAAVLDTGCATGNWISSRMVRRLGAEGFVRYGPPIILQVPNGGGVQSKGDIQLNWGWALMGVNINTSNFHVADIESYDVIFGNEYTEQKQPQFWPSEQYTPLPKYDPTISPYKPAIRLEDVDPSRVIRLKDESEDIRQFLLDPELEKAKMKFDRENMIPREPERTTNLGANNQYF